MGLFDFLKSSGKEPHRGALESVPNLPPGRLGAALREIYLCTHSAESFIDGFGDVFKEAIAAVDPLAKPAVIGEKLRSPALFLSAVAVTLARAGDKDRARLISEKLLVSLQKAGPAVLDQRTDSVEIHLAIRQIGGVLIDDGREPDWNRLSALWDQVIDIREKKRRR